jgi:putative cell wall-binding protein
MGSAAAVVVLAVGAAVVPASAALAADHPYVVPVGTPTTQVFVAGWSDLPLSPSTLPFEVELPDEVAALGLAQLDYELRDADAPEKVFDEGSIAGTTPSITLSPKEELGTTTAMVLEITGGTDAPGSLQIFADITLTAPPAAPRVVDLAESTATAFGTNWVYDADDTTRIVVSPGDTITFTAAPGFWTKGPDGSWPETQPAAGSLVTGAKVFSKAAVTISADGSTAVFTVPVTPDQPYWQFGDSQNLYALIDQSESAPAEQQRSASYTVAAITVVPADVKPAVDRVAGADRYSGAIAVAQAAFPTKAPVVYVVTGETYPDALSAGPAAVAENAPLLLTATNELSPGVADEIDRLEPEKIVVVGGANSVSKTVFGALEALVPDTVRIEGAGRYETSRALAEYAFPEGAPVAYIATGGNFPDALSAGAAAGSLGGPVVLVDGSAASIDAATTTVLDELAPDDIVIAGGPASVSLGVEKALEEIADTRRMGGADRFEASAAINLDAFPAAERAFLVTGRNFPDALAGSAWAGAVPAPLYVSEGTCVPGAALDAMKAQGVKQVTLIGGPNSLSAQVEALMRCP